MVSGAEYNGCTGQDEKQSSAHLTSVQIEIATTSAFPVCYGER